MYPSIDHVDFGQPDPPNLQVSCIKRNVLLVVAYTQHFVYAQIISKRNDEGPRQICRLTIDNGEDEVIACLTVVCLEDEHLIRATLEDTDDDDSNPRDRRDTQSHASVDVTVLDTEASLHESATFLLKGMVSMSSIGAEDIRIAVVLGTNMSR